MHLIYEPMPDDCFLRCAALKTVGVNVEDSKQTQESDQPGNTV